MLGLCFAFDNNAQRRDLWSWISGWFSIDEAWETGRPDDFSTLVSGFRPESISVADLPKEPRLVIMTDPEADFVQGDISLYDYTHPESAIYLFGRDGGKLKSEDFEGRDHDRVFVPIDSYDMWASHAAVATFYDRRLKQCRSVTTEL